MAIVGLYSVIGYSGPEMDIVGLQWIQWICNGYIRSVIGVMGLC